MMKNHCRILLSLLMALGALPSVAKDDTKPGPVNEICPISGKAAKENCTISYEDETYAFCCGKCRKKFQSNLESSLYHQLGGKGAISAAVDLFYVKVMADERINFFFEDVNMSRQHNKQKAFLSAALGGPKPWEGKDMRTAHAQLPGLNDSHFDAVAENLLSTLQDLKISQELIDQVMAVVGSTRDEVLGREPKAP